ncbi:E3 ubiquitin-protein ligase TM129 isoform X2 [Diceros bicornis minor]|uniref:E3 ubiquitin-protein ligase TM129 isoform X2 n=1 Tax=Diceros bicornis minor TaxID=77932 RepID=UPI0026F02718|nr:E3 ubiquitin-protein ligase TM129 isoform X2 [Diceros bicornis minor]
MPSCKIGPGVAPPPGRVVRRSRTFARIVAAAHDFGSCAGSGNSMFRSAPRGSISHSVLRRLDGGTPSPRVLRGRGNSHSQSAPRAKTSSPSVLHGKSHFPECPAGEDVVSQSAPRELRFSRVPRRRGLYLPNGSVGPLSQGAPRPPDREARACSPRRGRRVSPTVPGGGAMDSPEVTFTLAYLVFAVCFVFTPTEFHSAGLTVQNLLSGWLGSEDAAFVPYHLRRTAATLLCHSLLPLGYYVGMCFAASEKQLYSPSRAPEAWQLFLLLVVTLLTVTCSLIYYWSRDRWARHPLARTLALYALPQSDWRAVASSVNTEFRRIDKFATGAPGARVIVTDTWVMKVTTYCVYVAQQQDVHLTVTQSQQHELSPDSNLPVQLLTIHVASASPAVRAFDIRLGLPATCPRICVRLPGNDGPALPRGLSPAAPAQQPRLPAG